MYGCESWAIKKAERWRIDAFELWCWRRLLRVLWTARRSNQSILKKISPKYSLKGLMLKLKLQYIGHLIWRTDSLEKTLMLGNIEVRRRRGRQRMKWLYGITNSWSLPNSCPLSQWCHPTISSSVVPFSSCLQYFPASGSFPMSQLVTSGGQNMGVSASASVNPMNIQDWFPVGLTSLISYRPKDSQKFSNTTVQKHQFFSAQLSL